MERVTGIGGFFFRSRDPDALRKWFADLLGVGPAPGSVEHTPWEQMTGPTEFAPFKAYRDRELGGVIRFMPALMMGIGISIVAGIIYVLVWEVYMAATNNAYITAYIEHYIAQQKAAGVTGAALDRLVADMERFKVQYADPLFRLPMTFMEIFPVGLLISVISAAVLRNPKVLPARG